MVLAWSRHQYAELVRDQKVETWLGCHRRAFEWFGGVVSRVTIDNPKCAITKACYHDPQVQRAYAECAEGYAFLINALPPREPKKKGARGGRRQIRQGQLLPPARVPQPRGCQPAVAGLGDEYRR